MAGDEWRCRKHPPAHGGGVCPYCLRDRLLRLCPDCAHTRPCPCAASSPSSSSSSAASGSAVGRVYSLIERERRMGRSRSVAAGGGIGGGGGGVVERSSAKSQVFGWVSFRRGASDRVVEVDDGMALARSSSVSATAVETRSAAAASKARGWGRFIPGSIRALRHRKSRAGDCREGVR
uniref:Uncharacterized protein n=1 Tax=Leersia perrieri TaxID=77586 RepID=A0A0D9W8T7_9ORYZ